MNRIDKLFKELKKERKKAFIAYITAGDPNLSVTEKLVQELEKSGADIVELGIPFSDPIADGPTIQAASQRALKSGVNLDGIFRCVTRLRKKCSIPIVFMTYYNPVLQYGIARFFKRCAISGVDGIIVPDLPIEEAAELEGFAKKYGVAVIFLASPTTNKNRMKEIAKHSKGFVYYVSLAGVTGARKVLPQELASRVRLVKSVTGLPVVVGFGVSNAIQAKAVAKYADGVIVGSAIVKIIDADTFAVKRVSNFVKALSRAIHNV